jgi:hypothetical protein
MCSLDVASTESVEIKRSGGKWISLRDQMWALSVGPLRIVFFAASLAGVLSVPPAVDIL